MSITFGFSVPSEPGYYAEVDASAAGVAGQTKSKVTIWGQRLATGTIAAETLTFIPSIASGKAYFGRGSLIARTIEILKRAYPGAEVWAIAQDDDAAAAAATGTITVTGTATESGVLYLYIAGQRVKIGITKSDDAATIASAIVTAVTDAPDLPVTAAATAGVVTLTARNKGELGNQIDVRINYQGEAGGEVTPEGVSVAIVAMSGGSANPDLAGTIAAMVNESYDTIVNPYVDATSLAAIKNEMDGRWGPLQMLYGHVVSAHQASYSDLVTFGSATTKNDQHTTILGYYDSPTPPWEVAAALGALTAQYQMDADEASLSQGFTGLPLYGMLPPPKTSELTISERNILLSYGLATYYVAGGMCYLSRARTTYLTDAAGSPDAAYYDQRTLAILQRIIRADRAAFLRQFQGAALVDDDARVGGGLKVCSPALARGWFAGRYAGYELAGLVHDARAFLDEMIIEIHAGDPNRLDILYPPHISGWVAVTATKIQFRLQ